MKCVLCKKEIGDKETCYEMRLGYRYGDDFLSEEVDAYYHRTCLKQLEEQIGRCLIE